MDYRVATIGLVAIVFNIELVVAIFFSRSLRYSVYIDYRVATMGWLR